MRLLFFIIMSSILLTGCSGPSPVAELAQDFVVELSRENYTRARSQGTDAFRAEMGIRELEDLWLEVLMRSGSFLEIQEVYTRDVNGSYFVEIVAIHVNRLVIWELEYVRGAGAAELAFASYRVAYMPPLHADLPAGIVEETVVVGQIHPLEGRLTLPAAAGPLPAVVLVHDRGPWDMDASIFDNRPFRDIAHHLASAGIAVLRYDAVGYIHPELIGGRVTPHVEAVSPAVWARRLLAEDERIDQNRVYVLGHGFGGTMAALICVRYGYNGWIALAGTPRNPLEREMDALLYAAERVNRPEGVLWYVEQAAILFDKLYQMEAYEAATFDILGIPAYFLQNLIHDPPTYYMAHSVPALILQGTSNFEVFYDRDFELFKLFTRDNAYAEFRLYEGLNHFFMWSTMRHPNFRDYLTPGVVDSAVLDDIVDWIMSR